MEKIYILNGPNLNLLGVREPSVYGREDYKTLTKLCKDTAKSLGFKAIVYQSNHEGDLVDKIHEAFFKGACGIVINPGAYTHTSIALLDAITGTSIPTVEVHISKVNEREDFRRHSFISPVAVKTIVGKGINGYKEAIEFLTEYLEQR
jgi:3-dehydroquinate dehydratase-2